MLLYSCVLLSVTVTKHTQHMQGETAGPEGAALAGRCGGLPAVCLGLAVASLKTHYRLPPHHHPSKLSKLQGLFSWHRCENVAEPCVPRRTGTPVNWKQQVLQEGGMSLALAGPGTHNSEALSYSPAVWASCATKVHKTKILTPAWGS